MNPDSNDPRVVYADIIGLPRHQSAAHPHMSLHDRAAQFAPFAALSGYDEMVGEEARQTDRQIVLGESDLEQLDRKVAALSEALAAGRHPEVSVLRFVPDARKAGGRYETVSGPVKKLIPHEKKLILRGALPSEEISIDMDRILDLD
jgi:hypothetical protein